MKPNKIDYFETGEDNDFNQISSRDEKIKLLTDFLIKTDFEFSIECWNESKAIRIDREKNVFIVFHDSGGISLEELLEKE